MVDFHLQFSRKAELLASFLIHFSPHPLPHSPVCWAAVGTNAPSERAGALMSPLSEGKGPRVGGLWRGGFCWGVGTSPTWAVAEGLLPGP